MDTQTSSTGDRAMSQQGNTADSTNFTKPPPLESGNAGERQLNNVLALSPSLSLTLDDKFLAISGIDKTATKSAKRDHRSCGIGVPVRGRSKKSIDYYNVLWAEVTEDRRYLRIDYAEQTHEHYLEPQNLLFSLSHLASEEANDTSLAGVTSWIENLLDRAYGDSSRRKRAWVVVNPHAGPGGADKIWRKQVKPIFDAARMPMTVVRTSYSGEAVKLAKDLNINDFDIAVPCSGDGLPHEVFNGLGQRPDARRALSKIAVCHIPCGSGNAMSCNLYGTHRPTLAALAIVKGLPTPLDLISVTQGNRRTISFLSQALGMIADLDITTEHLRWMGPHRFTYGFLVLAMQKKVYPCDIAIKAEIEHKDGVKEHYRKRVTQGPQLSPQLGNGDGESDQGLPPLKYGTATDSLPEGWELVPHEKLGSFYCGNMAYMAPDTNFFAAALANDGLMDLVMTDGDISIMKNIGLQLSMDSGHFFDSPLVTYRKVSAYRIIPRVQDAKCCISIDGEAFPWEPFQAEVHRGLGLTLSKKGLYEAPGPLNWDKVTTTERLVA